MPDEGDSAAEPPQLDHLLEAPALRALRKVAAGRDDVAVTLHDRWGGILWASPEGTEAILGSALPPPSLQSSARQVIHEDDLAHVLVALRRVGRGETAEFGIRVRHAQGHWVALRTVAWPIEDPDTDAAAVVVVSVRVDGGPSR